MLCHLALAGSWLIAVYGATIDHHDNPIAAQHHADEATGDDHESCDHSCHALAHLIGLPSNDLSQWRTESCGLVPTLACGTISLPIDPPQKPPRLLS